ncbi:carotenoid biosynthesis protein [Candidatus Bathyarchaeota archaeon]|nr:carotenoid biosynthesis protein [Candidatus Bathyarchaeota archaeon]
MRKLRRPGAIMGLLALGLEATGVASGAYVYGDFPLKILGVPLCIPVMWALVMAMAYLVSERYGPYVGVLAVCGVDLVLEPVAYATGIWTWLQSYTPQVYFGSTIANALVWGGMCLIGIKLWRGDQSPPRGLDRYGPGRAGGL